MPYPTRASGKGGKTKNMMNYTPINVKRSQKNTAPTQNTYTRAHNTWYYTVRQQHSKLPRQRTVWPQQASAAKSRGAATRAADFTALPPLLPIDIDNQQQCCSLLLAEGLVV